MYSLTITTLSLRIVHEATGTLPELLESMQNLQLVDEPGYPRLDRPMLPAYSTVANYIKARKYYVNTIDVKVLVNSPEEDYPVLYIISPC